MNPWCEHNEGKIKNAQYLILPFFELRPSYCPNVIFRYIYLCASHLHRCILKLALIFLVISPNLLVICSPLGTAGQTFTLLFQYPGFTPDFIALCGCLRTFTPWLHGAFSRFSGTLTYLKDQSIGHCDLSPNCKRVVLSTKVPEELQPRQPITKNAMENCRVCYQVT